MELLPHGSLMTLLRARTIVFEATICRWLVDALHGLVALKDRNLIHTDIKPENLLITAGGRLKVADFGCAHASCTLAGFNRSASEFQGTDRYSAPETFLAPDIAPFANANLDTWSLGVAFYEFISGKLPWRSAPEHCLSDIEREYTAAGHDYIATKCCTRLEARNFPISI